MEVIFVNAMTQAPLRPFKLTVTDGTEVMRDNGKGNLVGSLGGYGTVNYLSGALRLFFAPPGPAGPITASGETVVEEYPYHAARVDFDFFLMPLSGGAPPAVTPAFVNKVLRYLEEVRPIHVILRTFNLVLPIEEELDDIVTDEACCGPSVAIDHWTAHEDLYLGDLGPHPQDTYLLIESGVTAKEVVVDDLTPFIHPWAGDPLVIASIPPQPSDGSY